MRAMKWGPFEVTCWTGGIGVLLILLFSELNYMLGFSDLGFSNCWKWTVQNIIAGQFLRVVGWVLLLGICSFNSSICVNLSWKLELAGASDMMRTCVRLGIVFFFQILVSHEESNLLASLGIVVIFFACLSMYLIRTQSP